MSYKVKAEPGVSDDLQNLLREQNDIPEDWRLSPQEVETAIDQAIELMDSLREDPRQGEPMEGRPRARILKGCRRLRFDPADPPPTRRGIPRPRMRLVWINEPDESAIGLVRVLAVTHRHRSRPYRRAATRLGALKRKREEQS